MRSLKGNPVCIRLSRSTLQPGQFSWYTGSKSSSFSPLSIAIIVNRQKLLLLIFKDGLQPKIKSATLYMVEDKELEEKKLSLATMLKSKKKLNI
ncbi:hypothetical protein Hanom_Chr06g00562791 [Helianthus anomalus]